MQFIHQSGKTLSEYKILILSATRTEIDPLLNRYDAQPLYGDRLFTSGISPVRVDFLITGVGLTTSALIMGKYLERESYDFVIQLGIAGSLVPSLHKGDLVCVKTDIIADEGVLRDGKWQNLIDMGMPNRITDTARVLCPHAENPELTSEQMWDTPLLPVNAVSVNTITTDGPRSEELSTRFGAQIEAMEGASFFYAAYEFTIPTFLTIRSISNRAGEARGTWDIPLALNQLNQHAIFFLDQFLQRLP